MKIEPFRVEVPEQTLTDLRERLARTRWPKDGRDANWSDGADPSYMQGLLGYWRTGFDWRAQEIFINSFAHFRAEGTGPGLHVVHAHGTGSKPMPLLLVHGWPSSFYEMLELVPLLADPARHGGDPSDAFDVVVPSLPGFGFSDPAIPALSAKGVGDLLVALMDALGYARFGVHAYDIGASVSGLLALDHPDRLIGYHTTEPGIPRPDLGPDAPALSDAERAYLALADAWRADEGGYMVVQRTRPQTLAYGLADSPAGLAAWIVEKWHAWTAPPDGDLERHFTRDQILANLTIYWATNTIGSANRWYHAAPADPAVPRPARRLGVDDRVRVPVGVALTATQPIERAPRKFVERLYPDIRRWVELPRGGHFVALEEPRLLADSIRAFYRDLR